MLYLLWGLLNIALLVYFIAICFKATKLIRANYGLLTSIIFAFGLLSFISSSNDDNNNKEPNSNQVKTWRFISEDSLGKSGTLFLNVELESNLISSYELGINCREDKQLKNTIPVSAYSTTDGFIFGTNWKPLYIMVKRTNDNGKFQYSVQGVVKWKLLGATIYTQNKSFNGFVFTDPFKKAKSSSSL